MGAASLLLLLAAPLQLLPFNLGKPSPAPQEVAEAKLIDWVVANGGEVRRCRVAGQGRPGPTAPPCRSGGGRRGVGRRGRRAGGPPTAADGGASDGGARLAVRAQPTRFAVLAVRHTHTHTLRSPLSHTAAATPPAHQVGFTVGRECPDCLRGAVATRDFAPQDIILKVPFNLTIRLKCVFVARWRGGGGSSIGGGGGGGRRGWAEAGAKSVRVLRRLAGVCGTLRRRRLACCPPRHTPNHPHSHTLHPPHPHTRARRKFDHPPFSAEQAYFLLQEMHSDPAFNETFGLFWWVCSLVGG